MDTKTNVSIKNVKLHFPLDVLSKALAYRCGESTELTEWKLRMGENTTDVEKYDIVTLSTYTENCYLTVEIDYMRFHLRDSFYTCRFNKIEDESNYHIPKNPGVEIKLTDLSSASCLDVGTQTDVRSSNPEAETCGPPKRKRGRPKLTDKHKEILSKSENNLQRDGNTSEIGAPIYPIETPIETSELNAEIDYAKDCQPNQSTDIGSRTECKKSRRYGLRGVRLNKQLMNAEKGLSDNAEENDELDREIKEESENVDTDFIPENGEKSDLSDDDENLEPEFTNIGEKVGKKSSNELNPTAINRQNAKRRKKKPGVLACKICNKLLCDYTGVYNHVLRKHSKRKNVGEYLKELEELKIAKCQICDVECRDSLKLRQHMEIQHQDIEPKTCNHCHKSFKNSLSLKNHFRVMHILDQSKSNICHLCTAAFKTLSNLKQHIKQTHLRKKDFACSICSKTFCTKALVRRHARSHGVGESKRVQCKECGKSFQFEYNLKRHIDNVHLQKSVKFHCSYCGKGFGNKVGMITHVQTVHFNLFAYSCKECSASFSKSTFLKRHMASSHGEMDFQLPELPSKNGIYDRTTENMYYCSYCSSGFNHKAKLVEHMHSDHADAFPYKCSTCNQGFLEKSFLDVHNMKVHDVISFEPETEEIQPVESIQGSADIFQFITTKTGAAGKIIAIQSEQGPNQAGMDNLEIITEQPMDSSTVYVQVADGSTTRQFMVQAPEGMMTNKAVVQDLSSILLQAARQTLQADGTIADVHEINLVIENPSDVVTDITEVSEAIIMTADGQEYIADPQTVFTDYSVISTEQVINTSDVTSVIQDGASEMDNSVINDVIKSIPV